MASPEEHTLRCLIGNILYDLLLVNRVIEFTCQMYKLEKKVIDIKVKCPVVAFFALKFMAKSFDILFYHLGIILYDRTYDVIYRVLAKDDPAIGTVVLFGLFREIQFLFIMESGNALKPSA